MNKYTNALWANLCFLFLFFIGFALGQAQYTAVFTKHDIYANANGARLVTTADVDGDGDLDVLSASVSDDSIRWYENDGNNDYEVVITATDGTHGTPQTVTVTVTDLNDNAPVFSSGTATVSVAEGQTATGYTATATDADASSTITYSITGGVDHSLFSITGGVLSFSAAPDYEAPGDDDGNNDYEVVVTATDGTHGTTQTVTVTVTDVDETAPALHETEGSHSDGAAMIRLSLTEEVSLSGLSIADDFTITGAASNPVVTSISVSGSEVTLTLSGVVVQGETVHLSYTKSENAGSIVDGSGNRLGDFSNVEVSFTPFDLNEPKKTEIFFTNPVRDRLEIHSESVVKHVALYSLTGRKVLDRRPNRETMSIDITSLAQGMYLMKVETENNRITVKLVKL